MATILSHSFLGYTIAKYESSQSQKRFLAAMLILPSLPDLDYVGYAAGVPYESLWGHRGFTHSIFFAALAALIAAWICKVHRDYRKTFFLFVAAVSHGVLDAFTNGGLGIAFFAPFSEERYFFPAQPIQVAPLGFNIFRKQVALVLFNEFMWIWLPCILLLLILKFKRNQAGTK